MSERGLSDYLRDILNSIEEAMEFTAGMSYGEFVKDRKTINAVIRSLEVLGEATKKIPSKNKKQICLYPMEKDGRHAR